MTIWLLRIFSVLALIGFSAAVWFAGPLIGFADARPLESAWPRMAIIGSVTAMVAAYYLFRLWRTRKAQKALEAGIANNPDQDADSQVLEASMNEAIATLKRSSGKRNFLYETPLVHRHRPARRRQDHGAGQFGPEISAGWFGQGPAGRRRRRHALLRLVVHRRGHPDRHRRALYDPGFDADATRRAGSPSCRCSRSIAPGNR